MADFGFLPVIRGNVKPWFDTYGATLNDATSFRHMIAMVQKDIEQLREIIPQLESKSPLLQDAIDAKADVAAGEELLAKLEARLREILNVQG